MPCLCGGCLLCCLFVSGLLLSLASVSFRSCEDPFVSIRLSSSWTRLLPCGISGKMTIPSKSLLSLLARLLALLLCLCCDTYHLLIMPPILLNQASNHLVLENRCLAMLPLCSAPLIALLVAGEDEVCSLLEHGDVVPCWNMLTCWDITIYLI